MFRQWAVIVERAGYGYSDDSNHSRDVMEVLSETATLCKQISQGRLSFCLIPWLV